MCIYIKKVRKAFYLAFIGSVITGLDEFDDECPLIGSIVMDYLETVVICVGYST